MLFNGTKKWSLLLLRVSLGIMFLSAGIPKLVNQLSGSDQVAGFFGSLGVFLPNVFAWIVPIIEVLGGLFLILGLFTRWSSFALVLVMFFVIVLTTLTPFDLSRFTWHLTFFAGLITFMFTDYNFWAIDKFISSK